MHALAYNPALLPREHRIPESEIAITSKVFCEFPTELHALPNPGATSPPCHSKHPLFKDRPNGGGFWRTDSDGVERFYGIRIQRELDDSTRIYPSNPVARHRCQGVRTGAYARSEDCKRWAAIGYDPVTHPHTDGYYSLPFCPSHMKNRSVKLGQVSMYPGIVGNLKKHIEKVVSDPDVANLSQETALVKTVLNKALEIISSKPDAYESISDVGAIVALTERIARVTKTAAEIDALRENHLSYKQVLVLLSACIEHLCRTFGKNSDPRTLLLNMLGDLPWPTGIARVHGSEGLIGQRGQLLLPAKPKEKEQDSVDVSWGVLEHEYTRQGSEKPVAPDQTQLSLDAQELGLARDQFAPACLES